MKHTLDFTEEAFMAIPTNLSAGNYLEAALEYWLDDMIGDRSFEIVVARVMRYLKGQVI